MGGVGSVRISGRETSDVRMVTMTHQDQACGHRAYMQVLTVIRPDLWGEAKVLWWEGGANRGVLASVQELLRSVREDVREDPRFEKRTTYYVDSYEPHVGLKSIHTRVRGNSASYL